jgi:AcrR family transcriptional regulator
MTPKDDSSSQSRKQQILEAAVALFADRGYYKTTTADVAREVGVTQPYVFHFFKTKENLYLAVLEQASAKILQAFATVEAPPEQLMEAMGRAFTNLLVSYRNEILLVMMAYATPEPAVREYTRQEMGAVYERIKARFEQAGLSNPGSMASLFIGQGLIISMSEALELPKLCPWRERQKQENVDSPFSP